MVKTTLARAALPVLAVGLLLAACEPKSDADTIGGKKAVNPKTGASSDRIKFFDASGKIIVKFKKKKGGYKVYDASEAVIGKLRVKGGRVKLKDASGRELAKIKRKADGIEIEDASGARLFKLKSDAEGTWKLKSPSGDTIVKCKPKDDGYEVRGPAGKTIAKVKIRDGKLKFKSEDGARLYSVKGLSNAQAGMWLAVPALTPLQRAGVAVYFMEVNK